MNRTTETETSDTTRWTAIDLLRTAVIAALIGAAIYLVASLAAVLTSDSLASPLELPLQADSIDTPFPADATIVEATALVDVETGLGHRLAWWAVTDGLAIAGIGFLELLRRILAKGSDPFTDANASRLRWTAILAVAFAGIGLIRPMVSFAIQDDVGFDQLQASWDLSSLAVALVLAALLELWKHGIELRTDQELTI